MECAHLAQAWSNATQDPVVGIEQTSAAFWKKAYELFCSLRTTDATDKQYNGRNVKAVRSKFEAISQDVSKFRIALRSVHMFQPTGTTEPQNLSMAIALHLKKRTTVSYDAKDYPHNQWVHHLAYHKLKYLPKYSYDSLTDASMISTEPTTEHEAEQSSVAGENDNEESDDNDYNDQVVSSPNVGTKRKPDDISTVGRKRAKADIAKRRHNEAAIRNAASIAACLKRKTEIMEEANALRVFSLDECVTEEDKECRREFMDLTRKAHLKRLRESISQHEHLDTAPNPVPTTPNQRAPDIPVQPESPEPPCPPNLVSSAVSPPTAPPIPPPMPMPPPLPPPTRQ